MRKKKKDHINWTSKKCTVCFLFEFEASEKSEKQPLDKKFGKRGEDKGNGCS
jgi:hypothetical protein